MPQTALSDLALRSFKPPEKGTVDYWDSSLPSFGCRVSQGGTKTFILKLRNSRRAIGRYGIISLAEARKEARRLLAEKTLGKVRPQSITFSQALDLFLAEKRKSRRLRTVANLDHRLKRHFSFKGQLSDLNHQEVARRLRKIKTSAEHDHALSVAKTFFIWAVNRRYLSDNPTTGLSPFGHTSRSRVLSDKELKAIWHACDDLTNELPEHFRTVVKLLICCGQRRGEIAALRTDFIADGVCTLPSDLTKNHRQHSFPLGAFATSILSIPHSDAGKSAILLFPARGRPEKPFNGWSKSKRELDKQSKVSGWTLHDLRRTFATRLAEMGVAPHIIERILNHSTGAISGVSAVYNRATYVPEMSAAIQLWENRIKQLVG